AIVRGWVIQVTVARLPKPGGNTLHTLWLWWSGPPGATPTLDLCWRAYTHRFDIEHTIRFEKTTLGWTTPALRHPEQADRWTAIITAAYAQLVPAPPLAADHKPPSGRPARPRPPTPAPLPPALPPPPPPPPPPPN